ncbi:MAG: hypothetical protein U0232_23240 [Thermomicrobiales bacterium]
MATKRSLARLRSSGPAIGELFKIVRELSFDELREERNCRRACCWSARTTTNW